MWAMGSIASRRRIDLMPRVSIGLRWRRRPKKILQEYVITRLQKRECRFEKSLRS